ncbi:MAG TPA: AAA domain-containing protein, partial [Polyangium sp.]|nr:AAA domain-containing protein [Polyangium sp.]
FASRFVSLSFQHRMHPDISAFSREVIYEGKALHDANTIAHRDSRVGWDFGARFGERRVWLDVRGAEEGGTNPDEVAAIEEILREFLSWVARKGPPNRALPRIWEVACLCFYVKQEGALRMMLQRLTNSTSNHRFYPHPHVEIVCGTVDRFQGREADLVLLSMRNTGRVGFLDSPNRLNVAVTRARQQLVIAGNAGYFARCEVPELQDLVRRTHILPWSAPARHPGTARRMSRRDR